METLRARFSIFQQKLVRSAASAHASGNAGVRYAFSHEPEEFEVRYARLLEVRDALRKVEAAVKKYIAKAHSLSKAAKGVGAAFGTPDLPALSDALNTGLDDDSLIKAIQAKVGLLDDTVKQRKKLEDLRLLRDHDKQRLTQAETRRASVVSGASTADESKLVGEVARWQAKVDHVQKEYDDLYAELFEALDFIYTATAKDGPWALVSHEMDAFRTTQSQVMRNVEAMFRGCPPGTHLWDPKASAAAVANQQAEEKADKEKEQQQAGESGLGGGGGGGGGGDVERTHTGRPKPPAPPGGVLSDDEDD